MGIGRAAWVGECQNSIARHHVYGCQTGAGNAACPDTADPLTRKAGNAAFSRFVQRFASGGAGAGPLDPEIGAAIDTERGGGSPLPDSVSADLGSQFGVDFGAVRVHTDEQADVLSRSVQAAAFTTGTDIFFSRGSYDPGSPAGRELLAHELTHVVQQSAGLGGEGRVSHPDDGAEVQARQVARMVAGASSTAVGNQALARLLSPLGVAPHEPTTAINALAYTARPATTAAPSPSVCCDSCAGGGYCDSELAVRRSVVFRQVTIPPGGHDPCLDLLQAIIDLLDEVAKRFRDAQDDPHDLFKFHRHKNESHPDHGSWDGHREKFYEKRDELKRKISEWDANDDCGELQLSPRQQEDLQEAREFGGKEYPTKPARTLREAEESEQESIWDKLRRPLPDWVVNTLIALGLFALAVILVVAFATGAGEVALAVAGVGLVLGLAIKAAMRAAGVRDTSEEA